MEDQNQGKQNNRQTTEQTTGQPSEQTSGFAITSLILGIVSFCGGWTFIIPILSIIFGGISLSNISKNPNIKGKGMAIAGLVLGIIAIVGWLIYVAIFGLAFLTVLFSILASI